MKRFLATLLLSLIATIVNAADSNATNVSPDQAEKLLKENKDIVVLDVRTPDEYAEGHIHGAQNLDFHAPDFAQKLNALDKSKTYLVHCAGGGRSGKTCKLMGEDQFAHVYHLNEGFSAWKKAGKPIEK